MLLYLSKVPIYTIMLLGRWCSDAFLLYIRKQVLEFSAGITQSMLKHNFYTIPELEKYFEEDPRTQNNDSCAHHISQIGSDKGQKEAAKRHAFHAWS